jgi:hypothetical protein
MAVIVVTAFDIATAAAFGHDPRVIGAFDGDAAAAGEVVVDVHVALGVMDVADLTVGAAGDGSSVLGGDGLGAGRCQFAGSGGRLVVMRYGGSSGGVRGAGRGVVTGRRRAVTSARAAGGRMRAAGGGRM